MLNRNLSTRPHLFQAFKVDYGPPFTDSDIAMEHRDLYSWRDTLNLWHAHMTKIWFDWVNCCCNKSARLEHAVLYN